MSAYRYLAAALLLLVPLAVGAARPSAPDRLIVHAESRAIPAFTFQDGSGARRSLADFRGKVLVLNVWATWCPPCRAEMPTLDALEAALGGPRFQVLALSIDRAGPDAVREFFREIGVEHLQLYIDPSAAAGDALGVTGIPTTLIVGPGGREIGRLIGAADWASDGMRAYFSALIDSATAVTETE